MAKDIFISGEWNALCDKCGFQFKASDLTTDWQGYKVCSKDLDKRNPQDFVRSRPETIIPPWSRPEPEDVFVGGLCTGSGRSSYATYAVAGCAIAGLAPTL